MLLSGTKKPLICIDRDGTLIYDTSEHQFLGRENNWREQVQILPHVVEGLRLLNTIPGAAIYMITNQPGVAVRDFPLLTEARAHEVCRYVVETLQKLGGTLHGYFLCPHASPDYVNSRPDLSFHPHLVHDCHCMKPALGMVFDALKKVGMTPENVDIYVIGDRATDVRTALNISGTGILIPFVNEPEEQAKVRIDKGEKVHIAENMQAAAEFVVFRRRDAFSNEGD
ncbi:MAG: HAD-IIIA family hydrolase [Desulfobulbaceae bacterium]|nr:HAD-IIIA family hydrolase [Desulfobulbaceae bacterium]